MSKRRKNIIIENLPIHSYAAEGKSLSKQDGKVIFVEKVVPGDVVDVQLIKNKKDWAEGFPVKFHQYSADRVEPFCKHFGVCGGCQWQMLPYPLQLQYKHQQVKDQLSRIGKLQLPAFLPIVGAEETKLYRNKLEYTFSTKRFILSEEFAALKANDFKHEDKTLKGFGGFHAKGVFDKVVAIDTCHLQAEPTNAIRNFIVDYARKNNYPFYDIKQHQGWLRTMMVRLANTGELMINIVLGYEHKTWRKKLLDAVLNAFPQITTLLYTINTKFNDSFYDLDPQVYFGKGYIIEKLEHFQFKIGPKSFFQTNTAQGEKLYQITREFAELKGDETVYDLYCGTGSIGIFVSEKAKKIIGVEAVPEAIEDAKMNAQLNNLTETSFYAGDVIEICNDAFFAEHGRPDVIITDPPRAGMHEQLVNKLLEIAAPLIVYVSCNPATQARDLALLQEKYHITKVQPIDMFPHTHHIENVVQLKLKSNIIN